MGILYILISCVIIYTSTCYAVNDPRFTFRKMLVEYAENPINIDKSHPRFSWIVESEGRNKVQTSCKIVVASSLNNLKLNRGDLWDSGFIKSSETIHCGYEPDNLKSNSTYYWKVYVKDREGKNHESPVAKFETAFLSPGDWKADWIGKGLAAEPLPEQGFYKNVKEQAGMSDTVVHDGNSLLLRYEANLNKKIRTAKAFISGVGIYELYINGKRVGDHVLAPAKTPYHKYILYDTYDILTLLKEGKNAFGIHLGNGWYNPYKKWWNDYRMQWFGSKKVIAQLIITYTDGTTTSICTGNDWRQAQGPVIYNCIYDGEIFDANLKHEGWNVAGYNDSSWQKVTVFDKPKARLISHTMPPIRVKEHFKPIEVKSLNPNLRVFDMGQNFAGWVRIKAKGDRNTIIKMRFAEDLNADGTIDIASNENARATAEYRMNGRGPETYEPAFTCFGFRYIEISSQGGPINLSDIEGHAIYSDNQPAGEFVCDNMLVNKIHKATVWSQKSNMIGYPMDCPQRDERLGWFGDAQVTAEEAMFNFDMALFYQNWFEGIKDNQDAKTGDIPIISPRPYIYDEGIEWSSTYLTMIWQYYKFYGDTQILRRHYRAMIRYMDFLCKHANDLILPKGWIGDWGSLVKGWKEGEPASVPTAFYYLDARIMADVASITGNGADEQYFKNLAVKIIEKYNNTYLNPVTGNYNDGSQMANSFPLYLGIVPDSLEKKIVDNLVYDIVKKNDTHLTTGVLGTKYMPEALAKFGRKNVAWSIINQKTSPGWNDMMKKYTTMCEFWTLKQSKNHVMMGSIDAWFYKYLAGIQQQEQSLAFSSVEIKPFLADSLGYVKGEIETLRGKIFSEWKKANGILTLSVKIPFNTSALIYVPADENASISEGGVPVGMSLEILMLGYKDGARIFKVPSGNYSFSVNKN